MYCNNYLLLFEAKDLHMRINVKDCISKLFLLSNIIFRIARKAFHIFVYYIIKRYAKEFLFIISIFLLIDDLWKSFANCLRKVFYEFFILRLKSYLQIVLEIMNVNTEQLVLISISAKDYCSKFYDNSEVWTIEMSDCVVTFIYKHLKWSMLMMRSLIKKFVLKFEMTIQNVTLNAIISRIQNNFAHSLFALFNETHLLIIDNLDLTIKLTLKIICVRFWNLIKMNFKRFKDFVFKRQILDVSVVEKWNLFETQKLLKCTKCHLLRRRFFFDDEQTNDQTKSKLCMRKNEHETWYEKNKIIFNEQQFEITHCNYSRCNSIFLKSYDFTFHDRFNDFRLNFSFLFDT